MADHHQNFTGYQIQEHSSSISKDIEWKGFDHLAKDLAEGYFILWNHHGVFTGKIQDSHIRWSKEGAQANEAVEHIVRLRAFNESKEYHFWQNGNGLTGRLREDGEVEGTAKIECIDTSMVLRGVVGKPFEQVVNAGQKDQLRIVTRHYIGYNENGQAGIDDYRFVGFK